MTDHGKISVVLMCFVVSVLYSAPEYLAGQSLSRKPIQNADSLGHILESATGRNRAALLNEMAYSFFDKTPAVSMDYSRKAMELSKKLDYQTGAAWAAHFLQRHFERLNELDSMKIYTTLSEEYIVSSADQMDQYRLLEYLARVYEKWGDLEGAKRCTDNIISLVVADSMYYYRVRGYQKAAALYDMERNYSREKECLDSSTALIVKYLPHFQVGSLFTLMNYLGKPGSFYTTHGNYPMAERYYLSLLDTVGRLRLDIVARLYWTGKYYGSLGRLYEHWGRYSKSIEYHSRSLAYFDSVKVVTENLLPVKTDYEINAANQYEGLGIVYTHLGDYREAERNFSLSLSIRLKNHDSVGVAMCLDGLGDLYKGEGKYDLALNHYQRSLDIKQNTREKFLSGHSESEMISSMRWIYETISESHHKLGMLYQAWGKLDLAMDEYKKALEISENEGYNMGISRDLIRMGEINILQDKGKKAFSYFQRALDIYVAMEDLPGIAMVKSMTGDYYVWAGDTQKAFDLYLEALGLFEEVGMQQDMVLILIKVADLYRTIGRYDLAVEHYLEAARIAQSIGLNPQLLEAFLGLFYIYMDDGNYEKALFYHVKLGDLKDSIFTLETARQLDEIEAKYETRVIREKLADLVQDNILHLSRIRRNRNILIVIGLILGLVIIISILFFRQEKLKKAQLLMHLERRMLRSQMNPHFLYNSLSSIQNFIINEKPELASKYLSRFSKLVRSTLDNSMADFIPVGDEIHTMENYLELQKARYHEKFDYSIELDDAIDSETYNIPPMLAQPFIENSIEHGIKHKEGKGHIKISLKLKGNRIQFLIEDNGIGRKKAREIILKQDKDHKSLATSITWERLVLLNKKKDVNILQIIDLFDEAGMPSGTRIVFETPYR